MPAIAIKAAMALSSAATLALTHAGLAPCLAALLGRPSIIAHFDRIDRDRRSALRPAFRRPGLRSAQSQPRRGPSNPRATPGDQPIQQAHAARRTQALAGAGGVAAADQASGAGAQAALC